MFRRSLKDKLEKVFGFDKTTFDVPSDAFEQDTLFVEITNCRSSVSQGRATAQAWGTLIVYTQNNKLPFGFFNKRIQLADPELTKHFFFYEIDQEVLNSPARMMNITERRCGFMFLFEDQYDPNQGELTSLEIGG